jgi:hypothetical protein
MNIDTQSLIHKEGQKHIPSWQVASKTRHSDRSPAAYYGLDEKDTADEERSGSELENDSKEIIVISSESEASDTPADQDLSGLLAALGPLVFPALLHLHSALPFLGRNLRQCFIEHCRYEGIPTLPCTTSEINFQVIYRFRPDEECEWSECYGSRIEWRCPFCDFHGAFNTREMLAYHLDRDHYEVRKFWSQSSQDTEHQWLLLVQWTTSRVTSPEAATVRYRVERAVESVFYAICHY